MLNSQRTIKAARLKKGDTIGLIAPASPITIEQLEQTKTLLNKWGYKTYHTKNVLQKKGYLAGTDAERLDDLHEMFKKKEINAIMCIRGGYGTPRLLEHVDYDLIRKNPKIFIGYSDITALLQAIYKFSGLICFHGVVGISDFTEYTQHNFFEVLTNSNNPITIESILPDDDEKDEYKPYVIKEGVARGELAGGNLALIVALMGTPFEIDIEGKLLFIEDIGEAPYKVDRMLTQLILSGKLNKAKGIVLGVFNDCDFNNDDITAENSLSLKEVLDDRLSGIDIPVMYGFSFGHIANQAIFPIGVEAELNTQKKTITLLEPGVL
ncbi:MAG: LD-carboxypeptidase [Bacteroidetes bacterium]|nr:MAG: LD-carboxypeptidase [Bacteroidota bacterium]RLD84100.1 MAG: LD-carboxypeptidase [Bacteroidota bacterium]